MGRARHTRVRGPRGDRQLHRSSPTRTGAGDHAVNLAVFAVGIHGHQDPQAWEEILPDVVHVHGKFFDIDDDGREPVVPIEELLDMLVGGGYDGLHLERVRGLALEHGADAFEMVARQQALCRAVLETAAAATAAEPA